MCINSYYITQEFLHILNLTFLLHNLQQSKVSNQIVSIKLSDRKGYKKNIQLFNSLWFHITLSLIMLLCLLCFLIMEAVTLLV